MKKFYQKLSYLANSIDAYLSGARLEGIRFRGALFKEGLLSLNQFKIQILYEDNHLLVLNKPGGILVQGDRTKDPTLLEWAKLYLKEKYQKPGNVYLGLVHRLDRVTSGVVVFARTSKAAARLAEAFREKRVQKTYLAIVHGEPKKRKGKVCHYLSWNEKSRKAKAFKRPHPNTQAALLEYEVLHAFEGKALLAVYPSTGRKHQIRTQLAALGHPIIGDIKYGSKEKVFHGRAILLHALKLTLPHPTKKELFTFRAPLPSYWPRTKCFIRR